VDAFVPMPSFEVEIGNDLGAIILDAISGKRGQQYSSLPPALF
jgi:hypothetical protein